MAKTRVPKIELTEEQYKEALNRIDELILEWGNRYNLNEVYHYSFCREPIAKKNLKVTTKCTKK